MNPILNHWYEFQQMPVMQYTGGAWPVEEPLRDLTIGPENLITEEDMGRRYLCSCGANAQVDEGELKFPDGRVGNGCFFTRWLSARECRERGLAATHPSQRYEPAREGAADRKSPAVAASPQSAARAHPPSPPASDFERLADDDKVKPLSPSQCDMRGMGERLQRCMHYREPKPKRPLSREQRYQLALEVLCGWQEVR